MQFIDRVAQRFRLINLNKRLHLPYNAADILAPIDVSAVRAQGDNTRLATGDAADIVACVLISNGPCVCAPRYHTVRKSRDTACVHTAVQFIVIIGCQTFKNPHASPHLVILLHPRTVVIDARAVRTVVQRAVIDAHNASRRVVSGDSALHRTPCDCSCMLIDPCDAAHCIAAAHSPLKGTVLDRTVVDAADASHTFLLIFGFDCPLYCQVLNQTVALHIAKQPDHISVPHVVKAGDRMSHTVKYPIEHRHDLDWCA